MKKLVIAIIMSCALIGMCGCGKKAENPAESVSVSEEQWKKEYNKVVFGWQADHGLDSAVGYQLLDLNKDGVPELITFCDGESFTDTDIYTYKNGQAIKLVKYDLDGYADFDEHFCLGGRFEDVIYYEEAGIICVESNTSMDFYKLEMDAFHEIIHVGITSNEPGKKVIYNVGFVKKNGKVKNLKNKKAKKDSRMLEIFEAVSKKYKFEESFGLSVEQGERIQDGQMIYEVIQKELFVENSEDELIAGSKFRRDCATFLQQFMLDENNYYTVNINRDEISDRMEFAIADLGNDDIMEILIRDKADEMGRIGVYRYNTYWQDGFIGSIHACDSDEMQMLYRDGEDWFHIVEFEDGELVTKESYEQQKYDFMGGTISKYYYEDASHNRIEITGSVFAEAPFQAWSQDAFGWETISGKNISELLW